MTLTPNFKLSSGSYSVMKFPSGEIQVTLTEAPLNCNNFVFITGSILSSDNLMELLQLVSVLKADNPTLNLELVMPYCAYSRQDRICNPGEAFSLKIFANLINSCHFNIVNTYDNHSLVSTALIDNCKDAQVHEIFRRANYLDKSLLDLIQYDYFISPDAGANKKVQACSKEFSIPMIRADKLRDTSTGKILETIVYATPAQLDNARVLIIDDICANGKTFFELAKAIKKISNTCSINLYVTHGFFSAGLEEMSKYIDTFYTTNSVCTLKADNLRIIN